MIMTFVEYYNFYGNIIIASGMSIAVVYVVLSLIYFAYRYAKGDDIPDFTSIPDLSMSNLSDVRFYVNPFYFKHPVNFIMTAMGIFMLPFIVAVGWPVLIPLVGFYHFIVTTRKKNIEKKKMWEELKS
jgi:hypothetical protein